MSRGVRTGTERVFDFEGETVPGKPIELYLDKKYPQNTNSKVKIIVSTKDRSYEYEVGGTNQAMQKRISSFLKESRKNQERRKFMTGPEDLPSTPVSVVNQMGTQLSRTRNTSLSSFSGTPLSARSDDKRVFGRPLEAVIANIRKNKKNIALPKFLDDIIKHIMLRGLNTEGIFRINAEKVTLESYKKLIDQGEPIIRSAPHSAIDLTIATGLVKAFLKELPESIVTEHLQPQFLAVVANNTDESVDTLQRLIKTLPDINGRVLQSVMSLMWNISRNEAVNNMSVSALAAAIGPVVFRTSPNTTGSVNDGVQQQHIINITKIIIENYHTLFSEYLTRDLASGGIVWSGRRIVASQKAIHAVVSVKFSTGFSHVVTASATSIKVWDSQTYTPLYTIDNGPAEQFGHIFSILAPKSAPPSSRNAVRAVTTVGSRNDTSEIWVGSNRAIRVWSLQTQELKFSIDQEYANMIFVKQMDGRHEIWAVKLQGDMIHRFDASNYNSLGTIRVASANLFVLFSSTNGNVYGGTYNGCVMIWDTNGNLLKEIPGHHNWKITCFTETDEHILSGGDDAVICLWDKSTLNFLSKIGPGVGKIRYLAYFDSLIWVCGWEPFMKIYTKEFSRYTATENYHVDSISSVTFVHNRDKNSWTSWTGSYDGSLCIWSLGDTII